MQFVNLMLLSHSHSMFREGIRRAKDRISSADVVVLLIDATQVCASNNNNNNNNNATQVCAPITNNATRVSKTWNLDHHLHELGIYHMFKYSDSSSSTPSITSSSTFSTSSSTYSSSSAYSSSSSSITTPTTDPTLASSRKQLLVVFNKVDLVNSDFLSDIDSSSSLRLFNSDRFSRISCASASGVEQFVASLKDEVVALCRDDFGAVNSGVDVSVCGVDDNVSGVDDDANGIDRGYIPSMKRRDGVFHGERRALITRARHKEHVTQCRKAISRCLSRLDRNDDDDNDDDDNDEDYCHSLRCDTGVIAEDLRIAVRHLGHITGKVRTDDILDIIFREFCIGK